MDIIIYLSISTGILVIIFVMLLILISSKNPDKKEVQKKQQGYNASVLRKHISSETED
ncbi:MAG: hypothetical protein AABX66_03815 [Nanoarchaeota archaeon]